ncbi:MAG: PKD domain-containing protein, partial [Lentisphaerae bacterium]|nr:PKD domain-containing protein [Lentisphaerota bacterium]
MKKYITKIAGTVLTASMIFAAFLTVSAQGLKISEFMMWVNDLDLTETEILSETDEIYILAVFEETFDGSQPYLELLPGGTTERPQLTFRLDGADRFAEFDSIGELYSQNDTLIFRYTPQPEDYGKGLSLRTSDVPMMGGNARYAIVMPTGLQIGNANIPGSTLPARNQYKHLTAEDFNTGGSPLTAQAPEIMINMYKITSPSIPAGLTLMSGTSQSMIVRRVPRGTGNTTSIELEATSDDTSICTVSSSAVIPGGQNEVSFTVTAVAPGTTVINVRSKLYPDEEISIPVRVDLSPSARTVTLVPSELVVGEDPDAIHFVRVQLGSIAPTGAVFNISGYSTKITGDATVRINPGQNSGQFNVYTPDGRASTILTLTDLAGDYNQAYFDVLVTNEVPVIETPLEGEIVTISVGEEKTFYFSASDKAKPNDSLSYTFNFGHGTGANRSTSGNLPWDTPYTGRASGEASHVYDTVGTFDAVLVVSDEDGGSASRNITVIVNPGVRLYVKVMSPGYAGLLGLGDGTIEYVRRTQIWDEEFGNVFSERESIQTKAIPAPGSFGFAWSADEGLSDSDLRMPANTPEELYALIKLEDRDLTVRYMFSREYYPGDGFGDADRDGLGDTWESVYFGYGVSSQVGETPA